MVPIIFRQWSKSFAKEYVRAYEEAELTLEKEIAALTPLQRAQFQSRFDQHKKSVATAYLCSFVFGAHYLYLGDVKKFILFFVTAGGFLAWWAWDFGTMVFKVAESNRDIANQILRSIKTIASQKISKV